MFSSKDDLSGAICKERLERLRIAMDKASLDALYVRDTANIEWMTAFQNVFDGERAHAAFVSRADGVVCLHTDSRYITAMQREACDTPFELDCDRVAFSVWAAKRWVAYLDGVCGLAAKDASSGTGAKNHLDRCALGIEDSMSLAEYRALERAFSDEIGSVKGTTGSAASSGYSPFVETTDFVLDIRSVKDTYEIEKMKAAQAITDAAFSHIVGYMKPGMTEREVQLELDWFMLRNKAQALAFPTIVACGENGASPHAVVSDKKLEAGQCVVMDFGARYDGYCSDMTRTVFLGKPEGEMLKAWETLRRANETVEEMLRPGVTGKEAHELALSVLDEGGFGDLMGHGLGHGVGIEIHEEPVLSPRNDKPLQVGNVVTVEPGIYIPKNFGMRLEDFGVITENGFEVFTRSTHEMVVI